MEAQRKSGKTQEAAAGQVQEETSQALQCGVKLEKSSGVHRPETSANCANEPVWIGLLPHSVHPRQDPERLSDFSKEGILGCL